MISDPPPVPPLPPGAPPPVGPPGVGGPAPLPSQKKPSWVQGCLIALAGLLLAGGSCFGCVALMGQGSKASDLLMTALTVLFGLGLVTCFAGCVLGLIRIVQRLASR